MITTQGIIIQLKCSDISIYGRITSGVKLINLSKDEDIYVASIAKVRDSVEQTEAALKKLEELSAEEPEEVIAVSKDPDTDVDVEEGDPEAEEEDGEPKEDTEDEEGSDDNGGDE